MNISLSKNKDLIMPKIALIGAGSTIFAKRLIGDILLTLELAGDTQIVLHDIDEDRPHLVMLLKLMQKAVWTRYFDTSVSFYI